MDNYVNVNNEPMDFLGLLSFYTECWCFSSSKMWGNSRIVLSNHTKLNFAVLSQALANSKWRSALICHTKELQTDLCICCPSQLDCSIFVCNS